jgi:predicted SAM-dependent methyltransferase/ribosomal protein L37AE/L43A
MKIIKEKATKCPSCAKETCPIVYGRKYEVPIVICEHCGFTFSHRAFIPNFYAKYENPNWTMYSEEKMLEEHQRDFSKTELTRVEYVLPYIKSGKWLDIGGSFGYTALAAMGNGFEASVLEVNPQHIKYGKLCRPEITWIQSITIPNEILDEYYDVVSMCHVLEHIPEPKESIQNVDRILKKSGYLYIEVPNWGSILRKIKKMNWYYLGDKSHINHFDINTLRNLVESVGFKFKKYEYQRSFSVNEIQVWKEPVKKFVSKLGFGNVLRAVWQK